MIDYEITDTCSSVCPYCQNKQDYTGDPIGNDGDMIEVICDDCGKPYDVVLNISASHYCHPKEDEE